MENFYALAFILSCLLNIYQGVLAIGINYGLQGDNLPLPSDAIATLQSRNVPKIRLFEPNEDVLTALKGTGISVIIGTRNEDLEPLAIDSSAASTWIQTNVIPYYTSVNIICIAAGNEVVPGDLAQYVPAAMQNLDSAMTAAKIAIPVSTAVSMQVLSVSSPPSQGVLSPDAAPIMNQITTFLASRRSPLLINVYPYYARAGDPANIPLDYALFEDTATGVPDGSLTYHNLFDAMVDAVYAALEKAGRGDVGVVVSETGWPTDGGIDASIENAKTYVNNLIEHVSSGEGTPRRPGKNVETYIFSLFKEDLKSEGIEQHWGLYYPNLTEVYHANL
ncbi:Glucan endo-1,3-beta-D-glucosidase [Handroanthus impetiginosus]|uniref:Glucan endo-1,3-beta-D-glucosidase n=1 Tax=Handroanthus impetiginosus TaxID=429701 RepID=A0A2G9HW18_9LAMI|nr:Glucan endo-1,3-beta-D-glucosidase [Handroanthus impetiginosus]